MTINLEVKLNVFLFAFACQYNLARAYESNEICVLQDFLKNTQAFLDFQKVSSIN